MGKPETPAEQALRLISPLKNSEFIELSYTDGISRCCLVGHIKRLTSDNPKDYSYDNCSSYLDDKSNKLINELREGLQIFKQTKNLYVSTIGDINNGRCDEKYPQKTIKGRCTAWLKDMIKAGL